MKLLLFSLLLMLPFLASAQCSMEEYKTLLKEAKAAQKKGQYDSTFYKLFSARVCRPEKEEEVNKLIVAVFREVNLQRELAEKNEREAKRQQNIAKENADEARRQRDTARIERANALQSAEEAKRQRDSANIQRNIAIDEREKAEKRAREIYANDLVYKSQIALRGGDRNTAFRLAEFAHRYVDADNPNVVRALAVALYDSTYSSLPRVANLEGFASGIMSVAFSPDGKRLATGYWDNMVKIWDLESSKVVLTLEGDDGEDVCLAFSPDGKRLASAESWGAWEDIVKIWDLESGKVVLTFKHDADVNSVAFSPNGKLLATGSGSIITDRSHFFQKFPPPPLNEFDENSEAYWQNLPSPWYGCAAKIWDLESGKVVLNLEGFEEAIVNSVTFSPDGKYLATGSTDDTARIWDLKSGKVILVLGNQDDVKSVAFSPDGKSLAVGIGSVLRNGNVKIWDLENDSVVLILKSQTGSINSVVFSPDGKRLATTSEDNTAKIWDLENGDVVLALEGHAEGVNCVTFSPDGKRLATGSFDNTAKIWYIDSVDAVLTFQAHTESVNCMAFSTDGKRLAIGASDKWRWREIDTTIIIWDLEFEKALFMLDAYTEVQSISFSPDDKLLSASYAKGGATTWDLGTGKKAFDLVNDSDNFFYWSDFSPDGRFLAAGISTWGGRKKLGIWDVKSGKYILPLESHIENVESVAFSSDGKHLATFSSGEWQWFDDTVKIWDLESGKVVFMLKGQDMGRILAFSPDDKHLVTSSGIWDLEDGKVKLKFEGKDFRVNSMAYSPDGKYLAEGGEEEIFLGNGKPKVKVRDLETGKIFLTFNNAATITNVAFLPDCKRLAGGLGTGEVKIWEISGDGLIQRWQKTGKQADLILSQLQQYSLENLLDIHPDNESKLLATGEVWQIAAFADLYANKIRQTGFPKKEDYERALRLYDYCVKSGGAPEYFEQRVAELKKMWKEKTE